jgi:hypothetical protein
LKSPHPRGSRRLNHADFTALGHGTVITTNNIDSNPPASLSTASGSAPSYSARAWVNFNGTGTVAIRDSGNVSSITDNGNGDYDINLTTAMPDTNGSIGACAAETVGSNTGGMRVVSASFSSTTVIKVSTLYQNGQVANPAFVGVQVFR